MNSSKPQKKTTKRRNAQKRRAVKSAKGGQRLANESDALLELKHQIDVVKDQLKASTASAASDPAVPALDEKYVKVPTVSDVALDKALSTLVSTSPQYIGSQIAGIVEQLRIVKDMKAIESMKKDHVPIRYKTGPTIDMKCHNDPGLNHHIHPILQAVGKKFSPVMDQQAGIGFTKSVLVAALPRGEGRDVGMTKPIKICLWFQATHTSAATTADNSVFSIKPGASAEFASLAALFDEYKAIGMMTHSQVKQSAGGVAGSWIVVYDPMDSSGYGALINALSSYNRTDVQSFVGGGLCFPAPNGSLNGFINHYFKILPGPQITTSSGVAQTNWPGIWLPCADAAVNTVGFYKIFVEAASSGTTTFNSWVGVETLFRART